MGQGSSSEEALKSGQPQGREPHLDRKLSRSGSLTQMDQSQSAVMLLENRLDRTPVGILLQNGRDETTKWLFLEDGLKWSPLALLSEKTRVHGIMSFLSASDRQSLRRTCYQLRRETDGFQDGNVTLILHNRKSKTAIRITKRGSFEEVVISSSKFQKLDDVPYSPSRIQTLKVEGLISSNFGSSLLQKCRLRDLLWKGVIEGQIPDSTLMKLTELSILDLDLRFSPKSSSAPLISWLNQSAMLKNMVCPRAKTVKLTLWSWSDKPGIVDDEAELTSDLFAFLDRFFHCKSLTILHGQVSCPKRRWMAHHPLDLYFAKNKDRKVSTLLRQSVIKVPIRNSELQELIYVSDCPRKDTEVRTGNRDIVNLDTNILTYVNSLETLRVVKLKLRPQLPLKWNYSTSLSAVSDIAARNHRYLTHLEIINITPDAYISALDFRGFETCRKIRVIKIGFDSFNNQAFDKRYFPEIVNFGPHPSFIDSLETLTLGNVRLSPEDLEKMHLLTKLKYLAIYGWTPSDASKFLTTEGLLSILQSRSLEGLLLKPKDSFDQGVDVPADLMVLTKARQVLEPALKFNTEVGFNLTSPDNPWWRGGQVLNFPESYSLE